MLTVFDGALTVFEVCLRVLTVFHGVFKGVDDVLTVFDGV